MNFKFLSLLVIAASCVTGRCGVYDFSFTGINGAIPNGSLSGYQSSETISGASGTIESLSVNLNVSGGFNGSLYGYLVGPSGGFVVLLNRVGVTGSNPIGYANTGFNVTFSDSAASDIHTYQNTSYTLNGSGQLTGSWQPDGRNVSPGTVTSSSPRTSMLSSFNGLTPNGTWTLFLSDVLSGPRSSTLVGWGLQITTVPEPANVALAIFGAAAGVIVGVQRWRRARAVRD